MEVNGYLTTLAAGAPDNFKSVPKFGEWLHATNRSTEFVQMMLMTLPSPRHEYYESANYDEI